MAPAGRDAEADGQEEGRLGMETKIAEAPAGASPVTIDIERIMKMIPHRYPFLMIERVINVIPNTSATGIKNVSINEPHFQGHFPQRPVMPGVLIIEAMAQTAGVLVVHSLGPESEGKLVYFMTIEGARFRRPVVPGDQLHIHVVKERNRANVWKFNGQAKVGDVLVAEATYSAMILDT
jgi:3-hydroxyacyl-[acyl-carrier-protein] dehydratase